MDSEKIGALLEEVVSLCREHMMHFDLQYSEVENLWYADFNGLGTGEYWEAKKCSDPIEAISRLIEKFQHDDTYHGVAK